MTALKQPIRVLITGAAGQIAYSLIPIVARGDVFGQDQPIIIHLLDIPFMEKALTGVLLEVEDCAFPLVYGCEAFTNEEGAFKDIEAAFLVGAMPRKKDMERKDLLAANVKIFASQGNALKQWAKPTCKVLVVGNPANTNALICAKFAAPKIPLENITAMTRLDENRAKAMLAKKNNVKVSSIENVIIWGNHSSTQFPDLSNATSENKKLPFDGHSAELIEQVQKRGAKIIELRSLSSAMSAAKAAADHMTSLYHGTNGKLVCMGVYTGNTESTGLLAENRKLALEYGAQDNLIFSLPVTIDNSTKQWKVIAGLKLDDEAKRRIQITTNELIEERQEATAATGASNL